jgi:hypothetical protein
MTFRNFLSYVLVPATTVLFILPQASNASIFKDISILESSNNTELRLLLVQASCVANDNLSDTAEVYIGRCRKGSIKSEFPGELLQETLKNIKAGSSANYKKAWKLLNDSRFAK